MAEGEWERFDLFHTAVVVPLARQRKFEAIVAELGAMLPTLHDPHNRGHCYHELVTWSEIAQDWQRAEQYSDAYLAEQPHSPLAWQERALLMDAKADVKKDAKFMDLALSSIAKGVTAANSKDEWVRELLGWQCRIACKAKRFDVVNEATRQYMEAWRNPVEVDLLQFEWDWIQDIPAEHADEALLAEFRQLIDAILEARKTRSPDGTPDGTPDVDRQ